MIWNWQRPDWPEWRFDADQLVALENRFLLQSGQLIGAWRHLGQPDQEHLKIELLSDEAMKTSAIEGVHLDRASVQSSLREQFGMRVDHAAGPAESGIAELMAACFEEVGHPLTHERLWHWHRLVCRGRSDLKTIGDYRRRPTAMQVVSGPVHKPRIHFEAPPSAQMHANMNMFVDWFQSSGPPALTKAGLAHLWFVSIHPFEDGNGRIARAISEKALAEALGQPSLTALSREIEKHRKAYYKALEANNRQMTITPWLLWFARTALNAQAHSIAMIDHLIAKTRMMDRLGGQLNDRQQKALNRLFASGPDGFEGGLSARNYFSITGASTATATRDLSDLVRKGALCRTGERKSARYWLNL